MFTEPNSDIASVIHAVQPVRQQFGTRQSTLWSRFTGEHLNNRQNAHKRTITVALATSSCWHHTRRRKKPYRRAIDLVFAILALAQQSYEVGLLQTHF